ncbi:MAG: PQQ-binding-like beta-propeller repeat protein [Myxococcota bacterium]
MAFETHLNIVCSPAMSYRLTAVGWSSLGLLIFIVFVVSCSGRPTAPQPCMSDRECRADRICHEGRCRFLEEVRAEVHAAKTNRASLENRSEAPVEQDAVAPSRSGAPSAEEREPEPHSNWTEKPMFMGGPYHRGRSSFVGPRQQPTLQWVHRTQARVFASPILAPNDLVFIGSLDGSFNALRMNDGSVRWRYSAGDRIYSTAALLNDGTVVVGSDDGSIVGLTHAGQLRFRVDLGEAIDGSPAVGSDGNFYATAAGVYAISSRGEVLWHMPTASHVRSSPTLHPSGLVVVGTPDGQVLAISLEGSQVWTADGGASIDGGAAIGEDGTIYIGNDLGHVLAFNSSGQPLWKFETGSDVRATPAIARDGTIVVGSYDHFLYAIEPTGGLRWKARTSGRIRASARIDSEGCIFVGSQDDNIYAFSPEGEQLWQYNIGQDVDSTIALGADGTLYVGADDGGIYALR